MRCASTRRTAPWRWARATILRVELAHACGRLRRPDVRHDPHARDLRRLALEQPVDALDLDEQGWPSAVTG